MARDSGRRVALLRGINVGGNVKVAMAELRGLVEALGLTDARTLLQSGNLVFTDPKKRKPAQLEALLEKETKEELGVTPDYMIRTPEEWAEIVAANPFPEMAKEDPSHLLVYALKGEAPDAAAIARLNAAIVGPEEVAAVGRELYITYPDGIGTSKLSTNLIEKTLGKHRGTGRNWNTVLKIAALLEAG
jgi:uncharacterized protein (DUF1697 family)